MAAHIHKLINFTYNGRNFDLVYVITDSFGSAPILPLIYTSYLSRYGTVYESALFTDQDSGKRLRSFSERYVSDSTARTYVYCLARFLSYLEACKATHQTPGMHASCACSERFVMHYLNDVLANEIGSSHSLQVHRAALNAYYGWLNYMGLRREMDPKVLRHTWQHVAAKNRTPYYIQYVSRRHRAQLLNACANLGEKLIMRMGYEVGLRTSEVAALRVLGKGKLGELFTMLKNPRFDWREEFSYLLDGKYTKGGRSRLIYLSRDLLTDLKRYFDTERHSLLQRTRQRSDGFFLRTDKRFAGTSIGVEHASRVFRRRSQEAGLNRNLRFHDLRHTFATELFHEEVTDRSGRETRSESAALIVTAQRLGHAFTTTGQAPPTTTRYIRLRLQMKELEY